MARESSNLFKKKKKKFYINQRLWWQQHTKTGEEMHWRWITSTTIALEILHLCQAHDQSLLEIVLEDKQLIFWQWQYNGYRYSSLQPQNLPQSSPLWHSFENKIKNKLSKACSRVLHMYCFHCWNITRGHCERVQGSLKITHTDQKTAWKHRNM